MLQLETNHFNRSEYSRSAIPDACPGKLRIATTNHIYFFNANDIIRIQSISNYSKLFFTSGKTLLVSKVLAYFDELLTRESFLRVHRTHLVNLRYLKHYAPGAVGMAALINDDEVPVSRRKIKSLRQKMMAMCL